MTAGSTPRTSPGRVTAGVVARPVSVDQLCRAVALATGAGHSVLARGGGSSYTAGFVPDRPASMVLDMRSLDRVVAVDAANMRVTVEAGCTWQALLAELEPQGLRTPFWGPLSGAVATVGGSLSQHAILWGSARHGISADSVIGLDIVLADGTLLATGAGAAPGNPFPAPLRARPDRALPRRLRRPRREGPRDPAAPAPARARSARRPSASMRVMALRPPWRMSRAVASPPSASAWTPRCSASGSGAPASRRA
jgi:hypothetical protein